jgi:hypothetical protein
MSGSASTERATGRGALTHWSLGLVVGGVVGIAPLALGTLGLLLAIGVIPWALADRPRGVALGGALVGAGGAWFVVWGHAIQLCPGPNTATDGCVGADLSGLIAVPILVLAVGGLISSLTAMRLARRREPPPHGPASAGDG